MPRGERNFVFLRDSQFSSPYSFPVCLVWRFMQLMRLAFSFSPSSRGGGEANETVSLYLFMRSTMRRITRLNEGVGGVCSRDSCELAASRWSAPHSPAQWRGDTPIPGCTTVEYRHCVSRQAFCAGVGKRQLFNSISARPGDDSGCDCAPLGWHVFRQPGPQPFFAIHSPCLAAHRLKKTVTILNLLHDMLRLFAPRVCEFRLHEGRHGQDAQEREGEKRDSAEGEGGRPLPPNLLRRLVLPAAAHLDLCAAGPCLYRKRTAQSRAREKWLEDSRQADETSSFPHEQHFIDSTVMVDT